MLVEYPDAEARAEAEEEGPSTRLLLGLRALDVGAGAGVVCANLQRVSY